MRRSAACWRRAAPAFTSCRLTRGDFVLCVVGAAAFAAVGAKRNRDATTKSGLVPDCPAYGRSLPSPSARCARKRHFGIVVVPSPLVATEFPGQRFYCPRRGAGRPVLYRRGPVGATPGTDQAQTFGTRAR